ncbi:MAG: hypothetical protein VX320_04195 [Candidatus Thermoplasmatota archaeon]|nr:hypothetical protein [Candidatus Thermoplasmatota archaeon]
MSQKKKTRKSKATQKDGLFDDLDGKSEVEIDEMAKSIRSSISATEHEHESLISERAALITLVQSLRRVQETVRGNSKERTKLLNQFRSFRSKADEYRAERDQINSDIPPPLEIIEQRLAQTHRRLATLPNDLTRMPNKDHEIRMFSFFFELQEMHVRKTRGNKLHQQYVELLREQEEKLKELDKLTSEQKNVEKDGLEKENFEEQTKANPKEIRKINKRIGEMLDIIRKQRGEIKQMRREAGRLEACLRVRKKSASSGKRRIGPRLEDVKQRASSGGTLSIEDLGALLKSGGLSELSSTEEESSSESKKQEKGRKRQSRVRRGQQRSRSDEERESRRG